jgi:hypothetical protein
VASCAEKDSGLPVAIPVLLVAAYIECRNPSGAEDKRCLAFTSDQTSSGV